MTTLSAGSSDHVLEGRGSMNNEVPDPGGVWVVVKFRSGHRLELCFPEAVGAGSGSYFGLKTEATLIGPDRSTARQCFASAAALLRQLGLPIAADD